MPSIPVEIGKGFMKLPQDGFAEVPQLILIGVQGKKNLHPVPGTWVRIGDDGQVPAGFVSPSVKLRRVVGFRAVSLVIPGDSKWKEDL